MSSADAGTARQAPPFHCPYCADEEISPYGESADTWRCAACLRVFTVRLMATGAEDA